MATRKIAFVQGEYFHVYNRGNSKQPIFWDDEDYKRFTQCLFVCNSKKSFTFRDDIVGKDIDAFSFDRGEPLVSIVAWTLMPNHFHIYLTINPQMSDIWEKNPLTEFIRKLSTAYVKYINAKYHRTGGLFEGAFKAVHVDTDIYAKYLFSYIHLNAIKLIDPTWKIEGIKDKQKGIEFLDTYQWSSYRDYKGISRDEKAIISTKDFPEYFRTVKDFDTEILNWLLLNKAI